MRSALFVHVDIDPPKDGSPFDKATVLASLQELEMPPSIIIDSGNGLQALWRLEADADDLERVKRINKAIAQRFSGDSGHNIDRLLRVPGTVNHPNAAKRKRGCVPVMARLLSHDPKLTNTLGELETEFPPTTGSVTKSPRASIEVPEDLRLLSSADLSRGHTDQLAMMVDHPESTFGTMIARLGPTASPARWRMIDTRTPRCLGCF